MLQKYDILKIALAGCCRLAAGPDDEEGAAASLQRWLV